MGASTEGGNPTVYSYWGDNEFYATAYSEVKVDGYRYYYLDYHFVGETGEKIYGETYSCYTADTLEDLTQLTFVYTKEYDNDGNWDIIEKGYTLDKNMDYAALKSDINVGVILLIATVGLLVLFIWLSKLVHRARKKK